MPRPRSDKRERLATAAAELVAARGLDGATIAAIAERAGVPAGSVYYYMRSKDEVAHAAVAATEARAVALRTEWSVPADPWERLAAYLAWAADQAPQTASGGNAATLAAHLRTAAPQAAARAAAIVTDIVDWAAAQFVDMGFAPAAASARALHLVTGIEGAGQLAHALADPTPIEREAAHLSRWVANSRSSA